MNSPASGVLSTTRAQRYRLAGRSFRFTFYLALEFYVVGVVAFAILGLIVGSPWMQSVTFWLALGAVAAGLAHNLSYLAHYPWLALAAAFEAGVVWLLLNFVLSKLWSIGITVELALFVFVLRYWQRCERIVVLRAHAKLVAHEPAASSS